MRTIALIAVLLAQTEDAEFVTAVNRAVDRADAWLARQQEKDGGFGTYRGHGEREYVAGKTALALLARIAAGNNQYAEPLERGFAFLKQHAPKYTYEVGLTLMAFDARCAPVGEWQQVAKMNGAELAKYTFPRALQPGDAEFLQPLVDRLVKERYAECWSYGDPGHAPPSGQGFGFALHADMSNTQYAALGLKAASRLGLAFDRLLFADLLDYVLDHAETKGKSVKFIDVREGNDGKPKEYARKVDARGFGYSYGLRDGAEICGSRACIAIACLELSMDELMTKGRGEVLARARKRRKDVAAAIDSHLAWLQEHFSVTENVTGDGGNGFGFGGPGGGGPAAKGKGAGFLYYYLYAMERVGALTQRKWIGRHDWYREGAEELIRRQRPDGSFESTGWDDPLVDCCFALLFLKRATLRGSLTASDSQ